MNKAKTLKRKHMPYRDNVACVVFNAQGKVFIGERKSGKAGGHGKVWQFPQGGIDAGEDPLKAAMRELYEETSITSISLISAISNWIYYDIPDDALGIALKGKYRGQRQKYFAFLFEGTDDEINVINPANGEHRSEFSNWCWEDIKNTPNLIVPFKRDAYSQVVDNFIDIAKQLRAKNVIKNANIKPLKNKNIALWVELRRCLWPKYSRKNHKAECEKILANKNYVAFGVFDGEKLIGFAEVSERNNTNNLAGAPIAWLEGIYISKTFRQKGLGKKLLLKAQKWAKKRDLCEFGSDSKIDNEISIHAHKSWGFDEIGCEVQFNKRLK